MEFILIKNTCPEWFYILKWLTDHPLNKNLPEPNIALNEGEYWQYMFSIRHEGKVLHSLRHLNHPVTHRIENLTLYASSLFNEDSILPKNSSK